MLRCSFRVTNNLQRPKPAAPARESCCIWPGFGPWPDHARGKTLRALGDGRANDPTLTLSITFLSTPVSTTQILCNYGHGATLNQQVEQRDPQVKQKTYVMVSSFLSPGELVLGVPSAPLRSVLCRVDGPQHSFQGLRGGDDHLPGHQAFGS